MNKRNLARLLINLIPDILILAGLALIVLAIYLFNQLLGMASIGIVSVMIGTKIGMILRRMNRR